MMAPLSSLKNYKLPLPSWSLADLKLGVGTQADDAAPALGRDEVRCMSCFIYDSGLLFASYVLYS